MASLSSDAASGLSDTTLIRSVSVPHFTVIRPMTSLSTWPTFLSLAYWARCNKFPHLVRVQKNGESCNIIDTSIPQIKFLFPSMHYLTLCVNLRHGVVIYPTSTRSRTRKQVVIHRTRPNRIILLFQRLTNNRLFIF
jgi:hypothetical protein